MSRLALDFPPLVELALAHTRDVMRASGDTTRPGRPSAWGWLRDAEAALLSDLTRPESQAAWLGYLARELGVPMPVVGCVGWRAKHGEPVYVLGYPDGRGVDGLCMMFRFGSPSTRLPAVGCPALDNPDAPDAPIRALKLAVETVAQRKEKP